MEENQNPDKWKQVIHKLLSLTEESGASDLHISSGNHPMIRVHGDMKPLNDMVLSSKDVLALVHATMSEKEQAKYKANMELDYAINFSKKSRFRANAFKTIRGASATFRVIPTEIMSLEDLGCPAIFKDIIKAEQGLIVVTGPTGSGKTTTLAAMIDEVNKNRNQHIITIEDPVEFVHKSRKCLVNQREVGGSTKSFSNALRSALREDPDIILVGELRDIETISLALTAAETGHIVFGTLHTNSAPQTINRIIDVFPGDEKGLIRSMLASSLQAVISQKLFKIKGGGGRVAAYEILMGTPAIRNLIREDKVQQMASTMQVGKKFGMVTMAEAIKNLVKDEIIDDPNVEEEEEATE